MKVLAVFATLILAILGTAPACGWEAREFAVDFEDGSSVLTTRALNEIQFAAAYWKTADTADRPVGHYAMVVIGHADIGEKTSDVVELSHQRAIAVADALVASGVPYGDIAVDWKGVERPASWLNGRTQVEANRQTTIDPQFFSSRPFPQN